MTRGIFIARERTVGSFTTSAQSRWLRTRRLAVSGACIGLLLTLFARIGVAGPPTGYLPDTTGVLNAEVKLSTKGKSMVKKLRKCQKKFIKDVAAGKKSTPELEAALATCLSTGKITWVGSVASFVPRTGEARATENLPCALSHSGGAEGAFDDLDMALKQANCLVYCCGSVPLPGDFCGNVPDPTSDPACTVKKLEQVGKDVGKLASSLLKCHQDQVKNAQPTSVLEACEATAESKFDTAIGKRQPIPGCIDLSRIKEDLKEAFRSGQVEVACSGTQPTDPSGCCQTGALVCADVPNQASCNGTFVRGECNAGGRCRPSSCKGYGDDCDQGEDCHSCPEDCGECPPPTCPNGTCGAGETCSNCPADCGACVTCPDGTCSAGENEVNCPQDCPAVCGNSLCAASEMCTQTPNTCSSCCCKDCGCGQGANDCGDCVRPGDLATCGASDSGCFCFSIG